jgi:hypothetical protein
MRYAAALLMMFAIACTKDAPTSGSETAASKAPPPAKAPEEKADADDEKRPAEDVARLPRPPETATAVEPPPPPEEPTDPTEPTDPRSTLTREESLGDLKLGITVADLGKLLPDGKTKGKREEEEATGEFVQTFVDGKSGVEVLLSSTTATGPQTVRAITVRAPSTRTTKRGIGIGASAEDVKKAYADVLDPEFPPDAESIIAGSVYDGVIFSLEAGKVRSIFMGPGAE